MSAARLGFVGLSVVFCLYGLYFIHRTSFVVEEERYYCLIDEAMNSMLYARNLIAGHGLTWNVDGPRVEGYGSLAWTLVMAAMHLPAIAPSKIAAGLQVMSLLLLIANLWVVRQLMLELTRSRAMAWSALVLTATYFPLNQWALQGTEVGLLALWVGVSTLLLWRAQSHSQSRLIFQMVVAFGTLIRTDMMPLALVFLMLDAASSRYFGRTFLRGLIPLAALALVQGAFRYFYYGDLLSNRTHLELWGVPLGWRLVRGIQTLIGSMPWLLGLPLLLLAYRHKVRIVALGVLILTQLGLDVFRGGDPYGWYGDGSRLLMVVMPLVMVLLVVTGGDLLRRVRWGGGAGRISGSKTSGGQRLLAILAVAIAMLLLNFHDDWASSYRRWTLLDRPFLVPSNRHDVRLAHRIRERTLPNASVAVIRTGVLPYFSQRECIDLTGKNDRIVARSAVQADLSSAPPRHWRTDRLKWNYEHSLRRLVPDLIVELRPGMDEHPAWSSYFAFALQDLGNVYVRDGSRRLRLPTQKQIASRLWWRGRWLEGSGQWEQARDLFVQAIDLDPGNEAWRYYFGSRFTDLSPLEEVEAYYDSTTARNPKPQSSQYFRAVALNKAGQHESAIRYIQRALEIDPAHEMSQVLWGDVLVELERYTEAIEHYRQALRIVPEFASAHQQLAVALEQLGNMSESTVHRRKAEALARLEVPRSRRFYYWGRFLYENGRFEAAIHELERALEADPDNEAARRLLAEARSRSH